MNTWIITALITANAPQAVPPPSNGVERLADVRLLLIADIEPDGLERGLDATSSTVAPYLRPFAESLARIHERPTAEAFFTSANALANLPRDARTMVLDGHSLVRAVALRAEKAVVDDEIGVEDFRGVLRRLLVAEWHGVPPPIAQVVRQLRTLVELERDELYAQVIIDHASRLIYEAADVNENGPVNGAGRFGPLLDRVVANRILVLADRALDGVSEKRAAHLRWVKLHAYEGRCPVRRVVDDGAAFMHDVDADPTACLEIIDEYLELPPEARRYGSDGAAIAHASTLALLELAERGDAARVSNGLSERLPALREQDPALQLPVTKHALFLIAAYDADPRVGLRAAYELLGARLDEAEFRVVEPIIARRRTEAGFPASVGPEVVPLGPDIR